MSLSANTTEIIMLGTGSAFPTQSYNTCFLIKTDAMIWLTDGGGGNGIFSSLQKAGVSITDISHIFVTHTHTDHIFGIVWILRRLVNLYKEGKYHDRVKVYANQVTLHALIEVCRLTFLKSYYDALKSIAIFCQIKHGQCINENNVNITFLDTRSENVQQTGFRMDFPSGKSLLTLGDEALTIKNSHLAANVDCVMCGAFCRYTDKDIYHPYEKHHYTVKDVADVAEQSHVKTLVLYHSEDQTPDKKDAYIEEARKIFSGKVIVPLDNDRFII